MNREILFRGFSEEYGWIYGDYIDYANIMSRERSTYFDADIAVTVNSETVGQFTGLCDKNGTRIFEGDIVEFQFDNDDCPFPDKNIKRRIGRVYFEEFRASFAIAMGRNGSSALNNNLFRYVQNGNRVIVIGNIYDNPELLKYEK